MVASPLASVGFLVRAWAGIFVVEASLRVIGYKRTLRWIERVPRRNVHPRDVRQSFPRDVRQSFPRDVRQSFPRTSVHLGERLVRKAYLAHALPGGCLPRSLVQYLLHRRDGTGAKLVVGVRRPDRSGSTSGATSGNPSRANETATPGIEAHAWVESDASAPIGVEGFAPIFSSGDSG